MPQACWHGEACQKAPELAARVITPTELTEEGRKQKTKPTKQKNKKRKRKGKGTTAWTERKAKQEQLTHSVDVWLLLPAGTRLLLALALLGLWFPGSAGQAKPLASLSAESPPSSTGRAPRAAGLGLPQWANPSCPSWELARPGCPSRDSCHWAVTAAKARGEAKFTTQKAVFAFHLLIPREGTCSFPLSRVIDLLQVYSL